MDFFDNASVVASTPGRLRIGIPGLYRAPQLKARLETELARHPAIAEVHASTLTARILLIFDSHIEPGVLLLELGLKQQEPAGGQAAARAGPPVAHLPASRPGAHAGLYPPWHLKSADEALSFHASSARRGLSQAEAERRLSHGLNTISLPRAASNAELLLRQFKSLPVILLAVSAGVSLLTGGLAEAAAIGAVLVLNGAIGFSTEKQAQATMAALSELVDDTVQVVRDGRLRRISSVQVAPGDIIALAPGTRIAADLRLLQAHDLLVDESPLTGESLPVAKQVQAQDGAPPLAERSNMAYRGTAVATGTGLGLVVGTGSHTEAGAIEALTSATERPPTPTQVQLDELGKQLIWISAAMCAGVFGLGLLRGHQGASIFKTALALAVAAVPEGLPTVATSSLARGIRRMREQHVLIRHLHAVDTIGGVEVICLDKTGTLTMNQMSVTAVQTVGRSFDPEGAGARGTGGGSELARLLQVCVLCNESEHVDVLPDSPLQGSATENALLQLADRHGMSAAPMRARFPLLSTTLRGEGRNYMRTLHALEDGRRLSAVKGSPDEVLELCTCFIDGGEVRDLHDAARKRVLQQNREMAARQLRVLGLAYAEHEAGDDDVIPQLTWVGLVGLADPLRPGVADVIERFHQAGIRTVMLTGDQAATAYEIGKALRLNNGGELNIINSDELDRVAPARLHELVAGAHVFSRVTPADKLRIVQALQASGATVAMTGDGINDAPALRAADIGIAMGSGAEVALSVADVALKSDQLDTMLQAISQGRSIAANTRKAVHFLLSTNLSEILMVAGMVTFGNRQPVSPMQLLWMNLLTDMLPAIALAAEAPEDDLMQYPPRNPRRHLVERHDLRRYAREGAVLAAGTLSAYGITALRHGPGARAATVGFDTLVLGQMLHALCCRSERHRMLDRSVRPNRQLGWAIAGSLALHVGAHLLPGLRRVLGISPLGLLDLLAIAAGAGLPALVNEWEKTAGQRIAATRASAERSTSFSTSVPTSLSAARAASAEPAPRA